MITGYWSGDEDEEAVRGYSYLLLVTAFLSEG